MKGTNILRVNHETVIEALQEYFDKRLVLKPVVKAISTSNCTNWTQITDAEKDFDRLEVWVQDNGAFLEGSKT
jgi:hypothetical protein